MGTSIKAYAALQKGESLRPFEYDPGELGPDQVEVAVEYCGLCHSDLSMLDNDWGMTRATEGSPPACVLSGHGLFPCPRTSTRPNPARCSAAVSRFTRAKPGIAWC